MKDFIEAMHIFYKYAPDLDHPFNCEHDYLYVDIHPDKITTEDVNRLDDLGFLIDEEFGGFGSYKYGSC